MRPWERIRAIATGNIVPTVVFGAVLVAALVYLNELRAWFSLAPPAEPAAAAPTAAPTGSAATITYAFPEASLAALRGAFDDYEAVRQSLAADETAGLDERGRAIAAWIRKASDSAEAAPESIGKTLLASGAAAEKLATAGDVDAARKAFGALSRSLVSLAAADSRLQEGLHVHACPMAEEFGFNKWMQPGQERENPYMGQKMLACGEDSAFSSTPPAGASGGGVSHEGHGHEGSDPAFYTCAMHPSVKEKQPGTCPICSMDLTPVTFDEQEGGVVLIDSVRRQRIGVRIGEAAKMPMTKRIRTVGKLTYDETKLHDITLKYRGWIEKLYANKLGQRVKRGAPLFAVYSPEIYAAQGDLITALEGPSLFGDDDKKDPLVGMARERLRLLDAYGIERYVKKTGKPVRYITIASPTTGYLVEKNVVDGSAVAAGARVMRIAGLDTVWLDAEIYEDELPLVEVGQRADISLTHVSGKTYDGKLTYIYPYLDPKTRTGKARIELDNDKLELKPDMYANVTIEIDLGTRLSVPESAIVYTGRRRLVFVDLGEGRLRPVVVTLGVHAAGRYEVLTGLQAGDKVVTSGNFLVAAESRIRSAALYWGGSDVEPPPPPPPAVPKKVEPAPKVERAPKTRRAPKPKPKPPATIYHCPMHPHVQQPGPGTCPICKMDLVPKAK